MTKLNKLKDFHLEADPLRIRVRQMLPPGARLHVDVADEIYLHQGNQTYRRLQLKVRARRRGVNPNYTAPFGARTYAYYTAEQVALLRTPLPKGPRKGYLA